MATASDVIAQLRTDLLADSTFTGLLGTNDILRTFPSQPKKPPFIVMVANARNPQNQISGVGIHRAEYEFDLFVSNPWDADPIYDHLEQNFTIPRENQAEITNSSASIDILEFNNMIEVPGNMAQMSNGQVLKLFVITFDMRIVLPEV